MDVNELRSMFLTIIYVKCRVKKLMGRLVSQKETQQIGLHLFGIFLHDPVTCSFDDGGCYVFCYQPAVVGKKGSLKFTAHGYKNMTSTSKRTNRMAIRK